MWSTRHNKTLPRTRTHRHSPVSWRRCSSNHHSTCAPSAGLEWYPGRRCSLLDRSLSGRRCRFRRGTHVLRGKARKRRSLQSHARAPTCQGRKARKRWSWMKCCRSVARGKCLVGKCSRRSSRTQGRSSQEGTGSKRECPRRVRTAQGSTTGRGHCLPLKRRLLRAPSAVQRHRVGSTCQAGRGQCRQRSLRVRCRRCPPRTAVASSWPRG
mmetsp:Transcript_112972/g.358900  ORF Transcript_112972/g.358900 Transcript_112972/m.358900 type:complete len:211 (-) Transcript_112972:233-865(-)